MDAVAGTDAMDGRGVGPGAAATGLVAVSGPGAAVKWWVFVILGYD